MSDVLELGKKRAEELGLVPSYTSSVIDEVLGTIRYVPPISNINVYHADSIHKLLGEGVELFTDKSCIALNQLKTSYCTHQALLIGIRPVKKESPERALLRELIDESEKYGHTWKVTIGRAKALLKEGE